MRKIYNPISQEQRDHCAKLLREMRENSQFVTAAMLPQSIQDTEWRKAQGAMMLLRQEERREYPVEYHTLEDLKQQLRKELGKDFDEANCGFESAVEVDIYEGYDREYTALVIHITESDETYAQRIQEMYEKFRQAFAPFTSDSTALRLYQRINSALYAARCITMDEKRVLECLSDLQRLHMAETDDHNGETTREEQLRFLHKVQTDLMNKYGLQESA